MEHLFLEEAKEMAKDNYEYFKHDFEQLYREYAEKYLAIKNSSVLGAYDSFDDALEETRKVHELGTFLVLHCSRNTETNCGAFHSNNISFCVV